MPYRQLCLIAKEQFAEHGFSEWIERVKCRLAKMGYTNSADDLTKATAAVKRAHRLRFLGE